MKTWSWTTLVMTTLVAVAVLAGCGEEASQDDPAPTASGPSEAGKAYMLAEEPTEANEVIQVREDAKDGDEVLVVGRIGGSEDPWIEGEAAFTIVDNSLKACSDIPGDACEKPWDYCCETTKLPTSTALVKFVDAEGATVDADARELLGVKELSTVVVKGKAKRDDAGNLTVLASGVYVKK